MRPRAQRARTLLRTRRQGWTVVGIYRIGRRTYWEVRPAAR